MASYSGPDHGPGAVQGWGQATQFMQPIPIYPQGAQLFDPTVDLYRAEAHLSNLAVLTKQFTEAAKVAERLAKEKWDTRDSYQKVTVLLLSWEEDDLGVEFEINSLQSVFGDYFHYDVLTFKMPSEKNVYVTVINTIHEFTEKYGGRETLLIIYYSGHGSRDPRQPLAGPQWAPYVASNPIYTQLLTGLAIGGVLTRMGNPSQWNLPESSLYYRYRTAMSC